MPLPLARIIQQLKREPSRTGSIVVTVFGDAIVPRGGSVWLGTLLEFFEQLDIDASVVRTAMSRLTADGWFERHKIGRNSFYRLVQSGRQTFDIATKHIYCPRAPDPPLPPRRAARSLAADGAVAGGLAGQGGARALWRDLPRVTSCVRTMA